jgi:hypothetical protein
MFMLTGLCAATVAMAQSDMPPELRGWEAWALHGHESQRCPWLVPGKPSDDARICAWPAGLELRVDERDGRFSQRWRAAAPTWLPLPGSGEQWPENVAIDGRPASVVAHEGTPAVYVTAGLYTVTGIFRWSRRPGLLPVPATVALVSLVMDGRRVPKPQRSEAGIVFGAPAIAREDDRVEVRVFRRLDDTLPGRLTTRLHLAVAGEAREIRLPGALPEGFTPTSVASTLAARLDPDNTLHIQVRPGEFLLTLEARGASPVGEVRLAPHAAPWPSTEVWSFRAQDRLRVAAVEGVVAVDPAEANVPPEWRDLPAYRLAGAAALRVVERSRGLSAADANELTLERTVWLDFSGQGYTIVDALSGTMRRDWRLDMAAPYALRSAHREYADPLLITDGAIPGLSGVELRSPRVELTAVSRLEHAAGPLPATGWRARLAHVSGQLIVAPGYRLLAVLGPDSAPQAWLGRWRLLDIFVVLLIAAATGRILGLRAAFIALAAMTLTYQETGAPSWLWLAFLGTLALRRAAPAGRVHALASVACATAFALLLAALIPFAITEARLALYPQLEAQAPPSFVAAEASLTQQPGIALRQAKLAAPRERSISGVAARALHEQFAVAGALQGGAVSVAGPMSAPVAAPQRPAPQDDSSRYEPGALVQAGPGLPDWRYHVYPYAWSGPVEPNATVRFVISPPWLTGLWRALGLALSALLLSALVKPELPTLRAAWNARPRGRAAMLLATALTIAVMPRAHAATTPDPALIDQLRTRLLEPPRCAPDCAEVLAADVRVERGHLDIALTVSALDTVGLALPGAEPNWTADVVELDGGAAGWVQRSPDGIRYISLTPGRHVVRIGGPMAAADALSVAFPARPRLIDVSAPDCDVGGVSERHLTSGALELVRRHGVSSSAASRQEEFPPFVDVDRLFHISHQWTIDTTVTRVAPRAAAFTVSLPLLAQEAVVTPGLTAGDGTVKVGLGAGEERVAFTSILPRAETLELAAPRDAAHAVQWRFEVAPSWHVEFNGVPAVAPSAATDSWTFEYYPRPGERLSVRVTRPIAASGGALAYDRAVLHTVAGPRSSDTTLALDYRSTQGGRETLRLPAAATVTQVLSDGEPLALRPEHGELSLSTLPGRHRWLIGWRAPSGAQLTTRAPAVALASPAANLELSLQLPDDRWVLYAFGPGVGPSVLYWSELLLFLVAATLLGRSALAPLRVRDWLLLGLGLSTFSWAVLGAFVLFMVTFHWRARTAPAEDPRRFNLLQAATAVVAVIALGAVIAAVPQGLLAHPDMRVVPHTDSGEFDWFVDRAAGLLPSPGVLSVPLWVYKTAMLAWALWLSFALTRWIRWAWQVYSRDGLWKSSPRALQRLEGEAAAGTATE